MITTSGVDFLVEELKRSSNEHAEKMTKCHKDVPSGRISTTIGKEDSKERQHSDDTGNNDLEYFRIDQLTNMVRVRCGYRNGGRQGFWYFKVD